MRLPAAVLVCLGGMASMAGGQPSSAPPQPPVKAESGLQLIKPAEPKPEFKPARDSKWVVLAIVNNRFLLKSDVERKVAALLRNERESREIKDPQELKKFESAFADRIINDWVDTTVMSEEALRRGFNVTTPELRARLAQLKEDAGLEDAKLLDLIERAGLTPEEVQSELRDIMLAEQLIEDISQKYMEESNLKRIYDTIPGTFMEPPKAHVLHILKSPKDIYSYKERQRLKKELEKIRKDILKGADFAEMARKHSDGYMKAYGGDMGWIGPQNNLPELVNRKHFTIGHMAFKLKPGAVSEVMESRYGFHLIKVVEKSPAKGDTFESARESVKNFVRNEAASQLIKDLRASNEHKIIINASGVPERYTKNLMLGGAGSDQ